MSHPSAKLVYQAKVAAEESFARKDYQKAAAHYRTVVDASMFSDPAGRLNMAHAYFLAGEVREARRNYRILARVENPKIAAVAKWQLGKIALADKDTAEALSRLKDAILLDRVNRTIIADFEILRSRYSGSAIGSEPAKTEQPDSLTSPVETASAPDQVDNAVVEVSDKREQLLQNLDKINMSEEQAKSILDAMKVNERQYIYQLRRLGARAGNKPGKKVEW